MTLLYIIQIFAAKAKKLGDIMSSKQWQNGRKGSESRDRFFKEP